jgi:hypothetical protein
LQFQQGRQVVRVVLHLYTDGTHPFPQVSDPENVGEKKEKRVQIGKSKLQSIGTLAN